MAHTIFTLVIQLAVGVICLNVPLVLFVLFYVLVVVVVVGAVTNIGHQRRQNQLLIMSV